jgi:hypothetical protein
MQIERTLNKPILCPDMSDRIGRNLNGPSVIKVPAWIVSPLGQYYMYFAHHLGRFIRMAYADNLTGPWTIYEDGVLDVTQTPFIHENLKLENLIGRSDYSRRNDNYLYAHIASPDVHVDHVNQRIDMYYHGLLENAEQATRLTSSRDGLNFEGHSDVLGSSYFRVFEYKGTFYAIAWGGSIYQAQKHDGPFEQCTDIFKNSGLTKGGEIIRHVAIVLSGDVLDLYYSCIHGLPETIMHAQVHLSDDVQDWKVGKPHMILSPELNWEGVYLPKIKSSIGCADAPEHGLRDPFVIEDHLFYSGAGEAAIGVVRLIR